MSNNTLKALGVLLFLVSTLSFANQGYYSNQSTQHTASTKASVPTYYSSSGNSNRTTYVQRSHRHYNNHHGHFSVAFATGNFPPPPVFYVDPPPPAYYVPVGPIYANNIMWINGGPQLPFPQDFVVGGGDANNPYPICRAYHRGSNHPGKLIGGRCHISYGGHELSYTHYQILTSRYPLIWMPGSNGYVPEGALYAGVEQGQHLFICQAVWQGIMHPGKIVGNLCHIAWQGKEFALTHYNVLVG